MTPKKLKHQEAVLDQRIARYLAQLDEADRNEGGESINRSAVQTALRELQIKKANNQTCQGLMEAQGLVQHIVGESDAQKCGRLLASSWRTTSKALWMLSIV